MKKILLVLMLSLSVFTSCESNDDNSGDKAKKIKVKSFIYPDGREFKVNYGPNGYNVGSVEKIGQNEHKTEIVYSGNNIMSISSYTNLVLFSKVTYTYSNDLIVKADYYYINPSTYEVKQRVYTYDSDNNVVKMEYILNNGEAYIDTNTYENGNRKSLTTKSLDDSDEQTYTRIFEYDDKNNYMRTMWPENYLKILFQGKNNMTKEPVNIETKYEYNSDNYPVKITKYDSTTEITYFYE